MEIIDNKDYTFKRLDNSNLSDLIYLMKSVHGKAKSFDYFQKKYNTKYTSKENIGYFAYDIKGEPAAFYGIFPCIMTDGKSQFIAGQTGDVITNPNHQKKGLFYSVAKKTHDLAKEEGIQLTFGFPNPNSAHGFFKKLNWIKIGRLTLFENSYKTLNFYNLLNKYKFSTPFYFFYFNIFYFFNKCTPFTSSNNIENRISVIRNGDYLVNKSCEKTYFVKINKFKIWFKFGDGILIGDVEKFDLEESESFFRSLNSFANQIGIKKIKLESMTNSFLFELFKQKFNQNESIEIGYLPFNDLDYSNLLLSGGDSDTF